MIGNILRDMRKAKGMSQKEMADKLHVVQTTISGWERGYLQPTFDEIRRIAEICGYGKEVK